MVELDHAHPPAVIPANAGTHCSESWVGSNRVGPSRQGRTVRHGWIIPAHWVPTFVGMTAGG